MNAPECWSTLTKPSSFAFPSHTQGKKGAKKKAMIAVDTDLQDSKFHSHSWHSIV